MKNYEKLPVVPEVIADVVSEGIDAQKRKRFIELVDNWSINVCEKHMKQKLNGS